MNPRGVPARAIAHLRTLKPGERCAGAVLAEAVDCDGAVIAASLSPYIKSGLITIEKEGRRNLYAIGTGKAATKRDDESDELDEPRQRTVKAGTAPAVQTNGHASIFHAAAAVPHPTTWAKPPAEAAKAPKKTAIVAAPSRKTRAAVAVVTAPTAVTPPQPRSLTVGLFNTGELVIEASEQAPLRLTQAQTAELVDYLLRLDQLATRNRL